MSTNMIRVYPPAGDDFEISVEGLIESCLSDSNWPLWKAGDQLGIDRVGVKINAWSEMMVTRDPSKPEFFVELAGDTEISYNPFVAIRKDADLSSETSVKVSVGGDFHYLPKSGFIPVELLKSVLIDFACDGSMSSVCSWVRRTDFNWPVDPDGDSMYSC